MIVAEFGPSMEHATPANVRKFMERMHADFAQSATAEQTIVIPRENAMNYEQVVAEFFARVLDLPAEQAVILLWIYAGELFYARLGEQYEQEMSNLFTLEIGE
jgi:hypothetical protein